MEPVPGPGQCSLCSSLGTARVGQEDADSGSKVDWLPEVLPSPHPTPMCTHTQTGPVCAEVFTLVRRCGSKCLCQMHRHPCACVSHQRRPYGTASIVQNSVLSLPPLPQPVWLVGQDWPEGYPAHPPCLGSASWSSVSRTPLQPHLAT